MDTRRLFEGAQGVLAILALPSADFYATGINSDDGLKVTSALGGSRDPGLVSLGQQFFTAGILLLERALSYFLTHSLGPFLMRVVLRSQRRDAVAGVPEPSGSKWGNSVAVA